MRGTLHFTTYCKKDKHLKKTTLLATCFALLLAFSSPVMADGHYTSGDDMGVEGTGAGVVISKSTTIRSTPSYSGKKVTSVPGGSFILASPNVENGWRKVTYVENRKTYDGWMLDDYMVHDQLILTLRKSNIPAYAAPTLEAKKVGSPTLSPLDDSRGSFCFRYCHVLLSIVFQVYLFSGSQFFKYYG